MKTAIIILTLFLSFRLFSQEKGKMELISVDLHPDTIITGSFLERQIKHLSEVNIFKNGESRTIVNKSILDNGFLLIEELWQDWDGSIWVHNYKQTYSYDGKNNFIEFLSQVWNGANWINISNAMYSYDGNNNLIVELWDHWDGSNWVDDWRKTQAFNGNNDRIEQITEDWTGINWVNDWKNTYSYDGNNNLIGYLEQDWVGMDWVNISKGIYTYTTINGIDRSSALVNRYKMSDNYPNPFNPSTTIKYQIPKTDLVILKVYDVLGKEVTTLVNKEQPADEYEIKFEANGLPSGIYFYRIQAGNFSQTKKMMLLK